MGLTYEEAKMLGLEHLWPNKASKIVLPETAPPPSKFVEDGMTKLERDFFSRANDAVKTREFDEVMREPMRFKVFGDRWYKPDFLTIQRDNAIDPRTFWETKGYERTKDVQKLIAAADRYPWYRWVLVKREKQIWLCRFVSKLGIHREVWTPIWLR